MIFSGGKMKRRELFEYIPNIEQKIIYGVFYEKW